MPKRNHSWRQPDYRQQEFGFLHVRNLDFFTNAAPFLQCCTPYAAVEATVVEATNQLQQHQNNGLIKSHTQKKEVRTANVRQANYLK